MNQSPAQPAKPLREITFRAIVLSIILTVVLAAANAFLGLKLGMTISASIPAAVISMGILRFFKDSNKLENNIVQTAASVGEALTAGIAFVLPALLLLHYWFDFDYLKTAFIALTGGILGVLYSIPLRSALLADKQLPFPEGTAIGNVLNTNATSSSDLSSLVKGGIAGALFALLQGGFEVVANTLDYWYEKAGSVYGVGLGFSPALMAAGYIVGVTVSVSIFAGILVGWLIGIPVLGYHLQHLHMLYPNNPAFPDLYSMGKSAGDVAMSLWSSHVRYIGVGAMLVGGFWTLITLMKPLVRGLVASFAAVRKARADGGYHHVRREDRDVPVNYVCWGLVGMAIVMVFYIFNMVRPDALGNIGFSLHAGISALGVVYILIGGFVISSISAYFAGLVGSSNNPVSGLSVSALLIFGLILYAIMGHHLDTPSVAQAASAVCILFVSIIACATAIANDTIQDLKAGQMVGATPWKQQFMLIAGVVIASFVIPLILRLLFEAYGIGGMLPPRCIVGIEHYTSLGGVNYMVAHHIPIVYKTAVDCHLSTSQMLSAPQASLMNAVVQGVFSHNLPWPEIITGAILAVIGIVVDEIAKLRGQRFPVLAMGLGIYLPLSNSTPLIFGGITSFLVNMHMRRKIARNKLTEEQAGKGHQSALLLACGVVAGAAVMGVILAVPFVLKKSSDALKLPFVTDAFQKPAEVLAVAMTVFLCVWMYRTAVKKAKD